MTNARITLAHCWRAMRFSYRCTQLQRTERSRSPREYFKRPCRARVICAQKIEVRSLPSFVVRFEESPAFTV